ncbi:hypothetical protein, variant [Aphanomyces invadans]|uniref:Diphthine--ammonia ligase n=1 Tax=Aphanomyces invadans TaxID=157072 RepID=A0A024TAB6_9STRA|nr:hypothetical protein, variant [Aphanomyces invadans]ETV91095.1 hypothetical protein, variant [Aphanomyces invadans]|eukprot:XP_008880290.1 hypothetical protein, variant [Aphanomyces invadans]
MKVVALVSGGKDSIYSMMKCVSYGHEIVCLATLQPPHANEEVDSFMFQSIGTHIVEHIATCMDVPWVSHTLEGKSVSTEMGYDTTEGDEVEDLLLLLQQVQQKFPDVDAVSSGAIFSNYQRTRVEHVCARLNLTSLAYLWRRDQADLMHEMIEHDVHSILVKVASMGLSPKKHLGKSLADMHSTFLDLHDKYQFHICGEGGEYETLTLDCPLYKKRLVIDQAHIHVHSDDMFAPVGLYCIDAVHLEDKHGVGRPADTGVARSSLPPAFLASTHPPRSTPCPTIKSHRFRDQVVVSGLASSTSALSLSDKVLDVFRQLEHALALHAMHLKDVVFVHAYVKDMATFRDVNAAFAANFPTMPPSRSCVQVHLADDVVLDCWASRAKRELLHVRSISEWAPTCIGPYSQANQLHSSLIVVAGQIPLVPATMALSAVPNDLSLCVANVLAVLEAFESNLRHIVITLVYKATEPSGHAEYDAVRSMLAGNLHRRDEFEAEGDSDESDDEVDKVDAKLTLSRVSPICVVTVPALPKGAPVEVEAVAMAHKALRLFDPKGYHQRQEMLLLRPRC